MYSLFLSTLGRSHASEYLRTLLEIAVGKMEKIPPGTSFDINPDTTPSDSVLRQNVENLGNATRVVLEYLLDSLDMLPS